MTEMRETCPVCTAPLGSTPYCLCCERAAWTRPNRDEAIRRLALGAGIPPELLTQPSGDRTADVLHEIDDALDRNAYGSHWTADAMHSAPRQPATPPGDAQYVTVDPALQLIREPWASATVEQIMASLRAWQATARPIYLRVAERMNDLAATADLYRVYYIDSGPVCGCEEPCATLQQHALTAHRNRNTGPPRTTRVDGRPTRADNRHKPHRTTTR